MGKKVTNAAGDQLELINNQWVQIAAAGETIPVQERQGAFNPGTVIGGQFVPGAETQRQTVENFGDFARGIGIGATNVGEFFGLIGNDPERDARERVIGQRSPVAAALGQGTAAATLAIPGAAGGEALAGLLGLRALGTFLASSIGGGVTAQPALEDASVENVITDVGLDAVTATALGITGRIPSMAVRVFNAITKGGKFKRVVEAGDQPGTSADLVNIIQDADIPITQAQASGNQADLLVEGSLRRNPFTIGPGFTEIDKAQQIGVNQAAARAIGLPEGTDFIDPTVISGAKDAIGNNIEAVVNSLPDMPISQAMIDDFTQLAETPFIKGTTGSSGLGKIARDLQNKLDNSSSPVLTANEWKDIRELVNAELGDSSGANTRVLGEALNLVDDMPNVPAELLEQYGAAREQWRTVLQLEKGATVTPDGNVNVGQLNRNLQNSFGNFVGNPSRTEATQTLRELSSAFATRRMQRGPSSGTAENLAVANQINQAADTAAALASGDVTGGAARGAIIGGLNTLGSPLHLGPRTSPEVEQVLRFLGLTGAAASSDLTRQ